MNVNSRTRQTAALSKFVAKISTDYSVSSGAAPVLVLVQKSVRPAEIADCRETSHLNALRAAKKKAGVEESDLQDAVIAKFQAAGYPCRVSACGRMVLTLSIERDEFKEFIGSIFGFRKAFKRRPGTKS